MSLNRITPLAVKFELHAYGEVYDFSLKSIANWKDLEFTLKRDKTSGVFHQISFPFEFELEAYDVVKRIYDIYTYRAVGDMYIYLLRDNWPYVDEQYNEPQIFNLDWTTYDKSDNKIEIDTKRTSLYDLIKAKNKIVYDIPVREIKEDKTWRFDRIKLENTIVFRCTSNGEQWVRFEDTKERTYKRNLGITYEEIEVAVKNVVETKTLAFDSVFTATEDKETEDSYFMRLGKTANGTWFDIDIDISGTIYTAEIKKITLNFGKEVALLGQFDATYEVDLSTGIVDWKQKIKLLLNEAGDRFYLMIQYETTDFRFNDALLNLDGTIRMNYSASYDYVNIDVISPKTLLQSLVNNMSESKNKYLSDIEDFNIDSNNLIMMSAAESIRGIQTTKDENDEVITEAQVHTSYRNFVEWMNTYGYEQHIAENKLTFKKRNKSFRSDLTAIELEEHECSDLREYVNSDYLYTGLKIGYNKKDIENINGRFEFNGVHDYSTDLNLGENILELVSPYRADCYGIEFLAQEREKETTDDKSDKDLFLINVKENSLYYLIATNDFTGNCPKASDTKGNWIPNDTLFNGNLNPYNLMRMNEGLLGVSVDKISFTASDSNSKIIIDDQPINIDYDIPEGTGLFDAHMYDIASKNIQHLPSGEDVNGIVQFKYKGQIYKGFIEEVSKNPAWETETTWVLYRRRYRAEK